MNAIYRYVYNDEIIYIGKTDNTLESRINDHAKEEKFEPYLNNCKIEYFETNNKPDTDFAEKTLIKYYNPILNVQEVLKSDYTVAACIRAKWKNYNDYLEIKKNNKVKLKKIEIKTVNHFVPYTTEEIESILDLKDYLENTVCIENIRDNELLEIARSNKITGLIYPLNHRLKDLKLFSLVWNNAYSYGCMRLNTSIIKYQDGTIVRKALNDEDNDLFEKIMELNNYKKNRFKKTKIKQENNYEAKEN